MPAATFSRREHPSALPSRLRTCNGSKGGDTASSTQGDPALRETLAHRYVEHGIALSANDIVLTAGGMHGLNLCINILTKPGDIVLIESPTMFPVFTALEHRGLRAIEIPYSPTHGLDPDQFEYLTDRHDVRACVLMPAHHFPTGVSTPHDAARRIVEIARRKNLPIIENGGYMDLQYGKAFAPTLKRFDNSGLVLQLGSFSNTLAPGYGMGWLVPGRFREKTVQMKFASNLLSGGIFQRAVADYMQSGNFNRHIRNLRGSLFARMQRGLELIDRHFPKGCKVTKPSGGFMCWVEGPPEFDSVAACRDALARGVGLPPGPLFSVREVVPQLHRVEFVFPVGARRGSAIAGNRRTGPRTFVAAGIRSRRRGAPPKFAARQLRTLGQRFKLRPHDRGMHPPVEHSLSKSAVGAADDALASDQLGEAYQAFGDEFWMFDHVGGVRDYAG